MTNEEATRTEFCARPFRDKESSELKKECAVSSCPDVNSVISPPTASECAERMAAAMAARALCPSEQEPHPSERPLCPPSGDSPVEGANRQGGFLPCGEGGRPINDGSNAQGLVVCVPPQAAADPSIGQASFAVCSQPEDAVEDTRPPQISECKEPPGTNTGPVAIPGACSSAEGNDPGEVRCCIKRCEISPEIFEKDPCGVPQPDGPVTSDYYKTTKLPFRFENPSGFVGYGCQQQPPIHPFYRTTSQEYGWFRPSVHTVPQGFFPVCLKFSKDQGVGGRYRNTSLDTAMAEKLVGLED